MKKRVLAIGVVTAGVVGAGAIGVAAWAGQDDERETRGTLGTAATYELSTETDDGGLEVTFEVQSSRPGETWQVRIEQDGTTIFDGERTTDEDAELDIDVPARDGSGTETFTAYATGPDGQSHSAEITH